MTEPESYVLAAFEIEAVVTTRVVIRRVVTPKKPVVLGVTTKKVSGTSMAIRVNTIQLSPVDPAASVTGRPCQVVFTDGTPTIDIDMQDPAKTFPANDGQAVTITALGDINAVGQGPPSDPFPYTVAVAPPPPPTVVPVKPTVTGVTSV